MRRRRQHDEAFAAWVDEHGQGLLRTAQLLTGDPHQAEEVVQAVLARALPRWDRIAAGGQELAYVRRALVNERTDTWRRRTRHLSDGAVPDRLTRDHADRIGLRLDLLSALQTLPKGQRSVLVLRYLHDLPDDEVADLVGCSPATVRSQASRGLLKLRPLLGSTTIPDQSDQTRCPT